MGGKLGPKLSEADRSMTAAGAITGLEVDVFRSAAEVVLTMTKTNIPVSWSDCCLYCSANGSVFVCLLV